MTDTVGMILWAFLTVSGVGLAWWTVWSYAARRRAEREVEAPHPLIARDVLAQLNDGTAIGGALLREVGGYLVIARATIYEGGTELAADGEQWVPLTRVRWLQHEPYRTRGGDA